MSDEAFGALSETQQEQVALALYQLTPDQLVKVLHAILETLHSCHGVRVGMSVDGLVVTK